MGKVLVREKTQEWFSLWAAALIISQLLQAQVCMVGALQVGYYQQSCPQAEGIVRGALQQGMQQDPGNAAALLRLHFHDCFVEGCDGSVLLDGPNTEKTAQPNLSLRGFDVVDAAKAELERQCAGVVSCADILAFAARDAVEMTGGKGWAVPAGRLDGRVSNAAGAAVMLPSPTSNVGQLTEKFLRKGFTQSDMIILSGAHTIGKSHCASVVNRLYPTQDAQLDEGLAVQLRDACPQPDGGGSNTFNLDNTTPDLFDNAYYANLLIHKGVLTSDQVLFEDFSTRGPALFNSFAAGAWADQFARAMVAMGNVEVKIGPDGEIRRNCRFVN